MRLKTLLERAQNLEDGMASILFGLSVIAAMVAVLAIGKIGASYLRSGDSRDLVAAVGIGGLFLGQSVLTVVHLGREKGI